MMLKLSQIITKSIQPIDLNYLLKIQKSQSRNLVKSSAALVKKGKPPKNRIFLRKNINSSNDLMAAQVNQADVISSDGANTEDTQCLANSYPDVHMNDNIQHLSADNMATDDTPTRYWEDTHFGSKFRKDMNSSNNGLEFTLMSYNILAQDLLEIHSYLYKYNDQRVLEWPYRLQKLTEEIISLQPDILCLQEVQESHLRMILNKLESLQYDFIFKKKTGNKTDGVAILYNRNLFELLERHPVQYYQPYIEYLNRENVGLIAKFCLKTDPRTCFIVSTTHLLYNPKRQDVRLAQIQILLAELDRISVINETGTLRLPVILTGDFNLKPYSSPYALLVLGRLHFSGLTKKTLKEPVDEYSQTNGNTFLPPFLGITDTCQHFDLIQNNYFGNSRLENYEIQTNYSNYINNTDLEAENINLITHYPHLFSTGKLTHGLNLTSVYNHTRNGQMEATTFQNRWITVDYIFYSEQFCPKPNTICQSYLKLLSKYILPTVDECHAIGNIPNFKLGSDHLSLAAKFYLERFSDT